MFRLDVITILMRSGSQGVGTETTDLGTTPRLR